LPNLCADCLEIWEPQPPRTLKACNGISLPLPGLSEHFVPCFGLAAFSEAAAASDGHSGSDQDQFSDVEWEAESSVAVGEKPSNLPIPVVSRALSSLMGLYASGSSESEGKVT
jgi:hypothetical protein